jgi:hypothetical protein
VVTINGQAKSTFRFELSWKIGIRSGRDEDYCAIAVPTNRGQLAQKRGTYMATKLLPWDSHSWSTRELNLPDSGRARQHSCHHCGRHFVEEPTGLRYAVHIGMQAFERLADEVTIRWLAPSCPDRRLDADYQDLLTRTSEQFEIWTQVTDLRRLSQKHPF